MRCFRALMLAAAGVMLLSMHALAGVPDSIAYQGQLTDASSIPVPDGNRDLILSIWTDSTGGAMVHSETVVVAVHKGLFSTCIGCSNDAFADIFTGQTLYLQTQLAGEAPMAPRIRLRSVPSSITSTSVHSVSVNGVARARGIVASKPGSTKPTGFIRLDADADGDGIADYTATDSVSTDGASQVMEKKGLNAVNVKLARTISSPPGGPEASDVLSVDSNNDGSPDAASTQIVIPGSSSVAINTKGTGADKGRTASLSADTAASTILLEADLDGDGSTDAKAVSSVSSLGGGGGGGASTAAYARYTADGNHDGIDDGTAALTVTPTSSSVAIKTKGTGADKNRTASVSTDTTVATILLEADLDGDGIPETATSSSSDDSSSHVGTSCQFGSGPRQTTSQDGTFSHASMRCATDVDGDGVAEKELVGKTDRKSGSIVLHDREHNERTIMNVDSTGSSIAAVADLDADGVDDMKVSSSAGSAGASSLLSGHMGSTTGTIRMAATPDSTVSVLDHDSDGDGIPELSERRTVSANEFHHNVIARTGSTTATIRMAATPDSASSVTGTDADGNGKLESELRWKVDATGPTISLTRDADQDGVAERDFTVDAKGPEVSSVMAGRTGSTTATIRMAAAPDSASSSLDADSDGDGIPEASVTWHVDATGPTIRLGSTSGGAAKNIGLHVNEVSGQCNLTMTNATLGSTDTAIVLDGANKRFGIGVASPSNPIEHSSGAKLTAGGVWTNASDKNLKENFQPVDGEQILDKIEHLPITEWNYRNESDDVKHIGPTAQDFKAAFGVGDNDKTISTIDPSGIALAAIKQLKKENTELKKQVEELSSLKAEVEQLKKLVSEKK